MRRSIQWGPNKRLCSKVGCKKQGYRWTTKRVRLMGIVVDVITYLCHEHWQQWFRTPYNVSLNKFLNTPDERDIEKVVFI